MRWQTIPSLSGSPARLLLRQRLSPIKSDALAADEFCDSVRNVTPSKHL
jgi:hypothetical protein